MTTILHDKEKFYRDLLRPFEGTNNYWNQLAYLGKYSVLVDRIYQIDKDTLQIEFFVSTDVKDIGTVLYDFHNRTNMECVATFNGVHMSVRKYGA